MSLTSCEDILGHWEKPTPNPITHGGNVTPSDEGGSTPAALILDLSTVTAATTIEDGYTVTGTLGANVKISIADGATVTLDGVTINGVDDENCKWAGITCAGDATIILKDGTTNTVKGFYEDYPGILAAVGHTLIIKGTGSLTASPFDGGGTYNSFGAGIGGGDQIACGNIEIQGGTVTATGGKFAAGIGSGDEAGCGTITISGGAVTATGGYYAAGIGSGYEASCGNITISGGTVTATGGDSSAGIGCGKGNTSGNSSCGTITITSGVTKVTATKGGGGGNSIGNSGTGTYSTCGTVTIGGTTGAITTSPYSYPVPYGALNGKFTINNTGKQVYFAKGNLQATTTDGGANWSWGFAANQWDFVGNAAANNAISGNKTVSTNGTVDLFGWSTAATYYGIHNSTTSSDYSGDFKDWGGNIGTGWRTLSKDEWDYLFFTRASGSKVNGIDPSPDNARYTHAIINTNDGYGGIKGMILFPDGVTVNNSDASWGRINERRTWGGATECTTSQWNALAAKGFVFLPTAGYRNGTTVGNTNQSGYYWSSTPYTDGQSYYIRVLGSTDDDILWNSARYYGSSVRLVYPID